MVAPSAAVIVMSSDWQRQPSPAWLLMKSFASLALGMQRVELFSRPSSDDLQV